MRHTRRNSAAQFRRNSVQFADSLSIASGDGRLSFAEFEKLANKLTPLLNNKGETKPELLLKAVANDAEGKMRNGGLSRQQRLRLRRAFGAFDADGSGAISYAELQAAFRQSRIVVPDAHLRRMFEEADADRSGEIEYAEFEALATRLLLGQQARAKATEIPPPDKSTSAAAKVFDAFERGGCGFVAADDLSTTRNSPQFCAIRRISAQLF